MNTYTAWRFKGFYMGDFSFLNRNKSSQTQQGVFNLYGNTQKAKSADRAKTRSAYNKPQKAATASLPNFTSNPMGSGSFFTSAPKSQKKPQRLTVPSNKGGKVDPVYSTPPVIPPKVSAFRGVPKTSKTNQAVSTLSKVERPTAVRMNKIRSYDMQTSIR